MTALRLSIVNELRIALLALLIVPAAVAGPPLGVGAQPADAVTLTYWSAPNAEELAYARAMARTWNATHPRVTVNVQSIPASGTSEEVLLAAVVAKTTPDICANMLPSIMNRFVHAGAVVALDRFADFPAFVHERVDPQVLSFARSDDGHVYQVPWKSNPVMLAYNRDEFEARHLRPPQTYGDFMAVARNLTYASSPGGRIDHWAMNPGTSVIWFWRMFDFYPLYAAASDGRTLLDRTHAIADRRAANDALQFLATGFKRGYFPLAAPQPDLFLEGRVGMRFIGPWGISYLERAAVHRFRFGFVPVPAPTAQRRNGFTFSDQKNISIFSTSRHPGEAWEFVKYITTKSADRTLLEMTSQIPLRRNLTHDPAYADYFARHPAVATFARQAAHVVPLDDSPHIVQILDFLSRQYEASAMYGIITPELGLSNTAEYLARVDRL
ncbi:MAG: extracellular solute-binding protein [Candidatus Velthaea sp.]